MNYKELKEILSGTSTSDISLLETDDKGRVVLPYEMLHDFADFLEQNPYTGELCYLGENEDSPQGCDNMTYYCHNAKNCKVYQKLIEVCDNLYGGAPVENEEPMPSPHQGCHWCHFKQMVAFRWK